MVEKNGEQKKVNWTPPPTEKKNQYVEQNNANLQFTENYINWNYGMKECKSTFY